MADKEKEPVRAMIIGAGQRGMDKYGELAKRADINMRIVAVAEPDEGKRRKMQEQHLLSDDSCFESGEEALRKNKFCDAVIIATPDRTHHKLVISALKRGYDILLEKPMATSSKQCIDILKTQQKYGNVLSVAHVLRYSPFSQKIKEIIDSGELGRLLKVNHSENVGYWHFAHSYVRGNWRRKDESGPVILTKCCHDLDLLSWFIGGKIKAVSSEGDLVYFKRSGAPEGSTLRCTEDCKNKQDPKKGGCCYNAERFYLNEEDPDKVAWPVSVISPLDRSLTARRKALREGPYGKCVYRCDNDVCDQQRVSINFSNNVVATFDLSAFGKNSTRRMKLQFDKGEIHGDLSEGSIIIEKYTGFKGGAETTHIELGRLGHHGGGDEMLVKGFIKSVSMRDKDYNLTSAQQSLDSHLLAFAAEEARLKGRQVDYEKFRKKAYNSSR